MGLRIWLLLGGSIVVEKVLQLAGAGDYWSTPSTCATTVIQAEVLFFSGIYSYQLSGGCLYAAINPAIRYEVRMRLFNWPSGDFILCRW